MTAERKHYEIEFAVIFVALAYLFSLREPIEKAPAFIFGLMAFAKLVLLGLRKYKEYLVSTHDY